MSLLLEIIDEIKASGAMSIARYMEHCLVHPIYGYYMKKDPFGAAGDFTTAPEISQMFGEIIAAWLITEWMEKDKPIYFNLVEMGPGRGTLMSDILRIAEKFPQFYDGVSIKLMEASPHLKELQKKKLEKHLSKIEWIDDLNSLAKLPTFFVANEFFDALPIKQFIQTPEALVERKIAVGEKENLDFIWCHSRENRNPEKLDTGFGQYNESEIIETSEASESIMKQICQHIKSQDGLAIIIDYGYNQTPKPTGDTLQAIKSQAYHPVLETPGDADLTAHVDFGRLKEIAEESTLKTMVKTQGEFLRENGIVMRAKALQQNANPEQADKIVTDLERLISPDMMGDLFKVMTIVK